ncbi:phytoene desaturase family protein [Chengkuizengella sediminis]|uniref:phytoene desaturase family protein n=1 Tax=Chengkuizengella sediminis TaxID=1885917 RepID=UPI00138A2AA6|nr:FAD-dependent oxidoreductase [Chengkuizengella sediminis]NDI34913.1 NAD(P)/FAD-dependent oxidoreductase [Chengkuizengella sediminis]
MTENQQKWDVIIIGGGIAGLTASVILAKENKKVLILEKAKQIGGRAATIEKAGGLLNLGPHAIYPNGPGVKILEELNITLNGGSPASKGTLLYENKTYPLTLSPVALLTSKLLKWKEKREFIKLVSGLNKINTQFIQNISLYDWVEAHLKEEKVKKLFYMLCRLSSYCNDPKRSSAGIIIEQVKLGLTGVRYLDGGWQTLVDQLKQQALSYGVTIKENHHITELLGASPDITLIDSLDETFTTKHVISTSTPANTLSMVKSEKLSSTLKLYRDLCIPVKGSFWDIVLKKTTNLNVKFALGLDEPLYYSNQSAVANLATEPNLHVIHLGKYLPTDEKLDPKKNHNQLKKFLDKIEPDWEEEVVFQRYLPSLTVYNALPSTNMPSINSEIPEIPGLYVAGDWVTTKGLLVDASITSAKSAADAIIEQAKTM